MDPKQAQITIRENIIDMFGIDKLPKAEQEEAIGRVAKFVFTTALEKILPDMSDKDIEAYEKLIDQNIPPEDMMGFLLEKRPDFVEIILDEAKKFQQEASELLASMETKS